MVSRGMLSMRRAGIRVRGLWEGMQAAQRQGGGPAPLGPNGVPVNVHDMVRDQVRTELTSKSRHAPVGGGNRPADRKYTQYVCNVHCVVVLLPSLLTSPLGMPHGRLLSGDPVCAPQWCASQIDMA